MIGQVSGGVRAIEASANPRVVTRMIWNSRPFPAAITRAGGKALSQPDLAVFYRPVA